VPTPASYHGEVGSLSDDIWRRRIVRTVEPSSKRAYNTGCRAFNEFCTLCNICPRFQKETVDQDVLALVAFIDWLFEKKHVQAGRCPTM
jgi:hypothetical protein